jgi:hypothetical protein
MRIRCLLPLGLVLLAAPAAGAETVTDHGVTAEVTAQQVTLSNALISRTWTRSAFSSTIVDRRGQDHTWSAAQPDFALGVAGQSISSSDFKVDSVTVEPLARGGLRVVFALSHTAPILTVERTVEAYPGVAGFRASSKVASPVPLPLTSYDADQIKAGSAVVPTIHAFRAGHDWRGDSDWAGPTLALGDKHAGDWRASETRGAGAALAGPAEWISVVAGDRSAFQVLERNDLPSSRAAYDGTVATTRVDFTRDILSLGPFEEEGHAENPQENEVGRFRTLSAGGLTLPAAFSGFAKGEGDEAWQFHKYLVDHRIQAYPQDVVFNADATDRNEISTGAKDDMNLAAIQESAPVARALGADVFTLDDGWQAASGDWQPDSPGHRDPRVDDPTYTGTAKFPARFPDEDFEAVRAAIAPMKLGLWMSPLSYHPGSKVYRSHPEWACTPTGQATGLSGYSDPDSSSNEAGLGQWSSNYLPFLEERLREAITNWQVKLFKFDFLVWLDCAGVNDLYEAHDRFLALIEKLHREFPDVAFAIDETNDYRLFPFESTLMGPTWFTNGGPGIPQTLHNTWTMSPWIPAFAIGHKVLTGAQRNGQPIATVVASTLLNEQMITQDVRPSKDPSMAALADQVRPWIDWGKAHREDYLKGVVYPLLDDPLDGTKWTALQSWNPDTGRGALLAFRQDDPRGSVQIGVRNVDDGTYEVRAAPDDALVGTYSGAQLREGLTVALPARGAKVLTITRQG